MRITCGVLFVLAAVAHAQPPAPGQRPRAEADRPGGMLDNRVDLLLRNWSDKTSQIKHLYAEFTRTTYDKAWRTKEIDEGSARFLHPNRARLDIVTEERAESHILTGEGELWVVVPPQKKINIFKLPPEMAAKQGLEDGPLPFLFGTKPETAKARYRFEIVAENDKTIHARIYPKLADDQKNFVWCEIWLTKDRFLPEQLKFLEPNDNEVTFVFKAIYTNIERDLQIPATDFQPRRVKGYEVIVRQFRDGDETGAGGERNRR